MESSATWISIYIVILILQQCCLMVRSQDQGLLNSRSVVLSPSINTQEVEISPGSSLKIEISNLTTPSIQFGIIEVHSYFVDVTISYNETLSPGFYTNGTNIGLVVLSSEQQSSSTFVYLKSDNSAHVLLILQAYDSNAPIPGGCNMEQSIRTAPFLPTQFTSSLVTVEYPLASWPLNVRPATCDKTPKQYDIYQYYLPENDKTLRTIFDSILLMSGVSLAESNGRKIEFNGSPPSKIKLANYKGTGRIVVIVTRGLASSAAYVPTLSFGCNPNSDDNEDETCKLLVSVWTKLLVASLLIVGLFHTMLGHRFYKTHLFLHGFSATSIISSILLVSFVEIDATAAQLTTIAIGGLGGLLLLLIWCRFDVPLLAVFLACLLVGFIFSSTIAYTPLADYPVMKNDAEFWLAFISFVLLPSIVLISFTHTASIICTSFVGSFLSIIILDLFLGSNLKFIVFNIFHRATQSEFQTAVVDPPFQTADTILVIVWSILAVTGTLFQSWREKDRAPFPNRPAWFTRRSTSSTVTILPAANTAPTEVTPLLYNNSESA